MLNPWRPRNYHARRVPVLLWMMNGQPIGTMGVASKLKGPLKCSQSDMSKARVGISADAGFADIEIGSI